MRVMDPTRINGGATPKCRMRPTADTQLLLTTGSVGSGEGSVDIIGMWQVASNGAGRPSFPGRSTRV